MNVKFKVTDWKDHEKIYEDDPFLELLHSPNCLQTHGEFIQQWSIMRDVYATALIYKNKSLPSRPPKSLWVLPTGEMKINPTGLLFEQMDVDDVISNYEHINNQFPSAAPRYFQPWEIMRYIDGPTDRYYFGISKIVTNKLIVSNLQQALTTRNVILADRGAFGILSNNIPDAKPIGKEERRVIEQDYRQSYGNSDEQMKMIITNSDVKWQPISFPTKDLMTFEEVENCLELLCDIYGLQRDLFSSSSTTKPSPIGGDGAGKVQEALKVTYETTIAQTAEDFCRGFNRDPDFGLKARNRRLTPFYDHLPIMKEDQKDASIVDMNKQTAYSVQTASLMSLLNNLKTGIISYDQALQIAIEVQCIDPDVAKKIITQPIEIIPALDPADDEKMLRLINKICNITDVP